MRLRDWIGDRAQKMLAPLAGPFGIVRGMLAGRRGELPKRGTKEHLEVFEAAPWPRAVGDKVATAVACTEFRLFALKRGGKIVRDLRLQKAPMAVRQRLLQEARTDLQEITESPFLTGLTSPNPFMDGMALLKLTEIHLDFVGDAFWLKDRNALGKPAGYWPIPPHWIVETPSPDMPTFRVSWRSWQAVIPASEIHWFHEPAPANPYMRGTGVGWALGDEIQVDEYAAKMAAVFFLNRARPDFVFATGVGEDETKRFEQDWLNRLQSFWRSHRPFFLAGEGEVDLKKRIYEFQQPTMEQLVYPNLRKVQRDIILQTWGVPPELFGIVENSNRATVEAAEYLFTKHVIAPKVERLRSALQRLFVEEFDERGIVDCVSPVAEDKEHQLSVAKAAPHSLSLDEWRQLAGLEPIGGELGKSRVVPMASYITADPLDPATRPQGAGAAMRSTDAPPEPKPAPPPKGN